MALIIQPDDLEVSMFVMIHASDIMPSDYPMYLPFHGLPLQVCAIELPYLVTRFPSNQKMIIDVRACDLQACPLNYQQSLFG